MHRRLQICKVFRLQIDCWLSLHFCYWLLFGKPGGTRHNGTLSMTVQLHCHSFDFPLEISWKYKSLPQCKTRTGIVLMRQKILLSNGRRLAKNGLQYSNNAMWHITISKSMTYRKENIRAPRFCLYVIQHCSWYCFNSIYKTKNKSIQ